MHHLCTTAAVEVQLADASMKTEPVNGEALCHYALPDEGRSGRRLGSGGPRVILQCNTNQLPVVTQAQARSLLDVALQQADLELLAAWEEDTNLASWVLWR